MGRVRGIRIATGSPHRVASLCRHDVSNLRSAVTIPAKIMSNTTTGPGDLAEVRASLATLLSDTDEMQRIHRTAETYGRLPRNSLQARELVADLVGDAFVGVFTPAANCVAAQLHDEVRQRARRLARAFSNHVPLTALTEDQVPLMPPPSETLAHGDDGYPALADVPQLLRDLRQRASRDVAVLQLLDLYAAGRFRRSDARRIGMSIQTYRAARERLSQLVLAATSATPMEHSIPEAPAHGADTTPLVPRHRLGTRRAARQTTAAHRDHRTA
jgi:hypothetical protein